MNYLITKTGKLITIPAGHRHDIYCNQQLGCTLRQFLLKRKGIRIKISNEVIAIEYWHYPTNKQLSAVKCCLRKDLYYTIITPFGSKDCVRPIRRIPDELLRLVK